MLTLYIFNDTTGNEDIGNYNYLVTVNSNMIASGHIDGHYRKNGWKELVNKIITDKNMKEGDEEDGERTST